MGDGATPRTPTRDPAAGREDLDAAGLVSWAKLCLRRLGEAREEINALNVFPVPDSDTGTNLLHTMRAAVEQAEGEAAWTGGAGGSSGAREVAVALGQGAVHGARGNSGVILSQVLRAIGEATAFTAVDAATLRQALRAAVTLVDRALGEPVEGTIVTVLRSAADAAERSSAEQLPELSRVLADAAADALDRTPEQLGVLRQAGVVDAGGRGLLVLFDSLVEELTGTAPKRCDYRPRGGAGGPATGSAAPEQKVRTGGSHTGGDRPANPDDGPRFEVMYSLTHLDDAGADSVRRQLVGLGDSVIVVGDGGAADTARWTVHVHTDAIGEAIESGLGHGRISEIRVCDLREIDGEHAEPAGRPGAVPGSGSNAEAGSESGTGEDEAHEVTRSIVAVAPDGPISQLFTDAGAVVVPDDRGPDAVVEAVLADGSPETVVLPNGAMSRSEVGRIDAGARGLGRHVVVVPTSSVTQGLAAVAVHDPTAPLSVDAFSMADAAAGTRHGHLVRARHDALTLVGRCHEGDLLGMVGHDVALIATEPVEAVERVADLLLSAGGEMLTLLLGPALSGRDREELLSRLEDAHPDVDIVTYDAGDGEVLAHLGVE